MRQQQIEKPLRNLVARFGYANVQKELHKLNSVTAEVEVKRVSKRDKASGATNGTGSKKKASKPNAERCVRKMDIADLTKREILYSLATKYEEKKFMPNVNHVRNFLSGGERDVSRIKSRQQVTNAVFKKLAALETSRLQEIVDRGLYGPPKRLASYARAIEGFRRPNSPA